MSYCPGVKKFFNELNRLELTILYRIALATQLATHDERDCIGPFGPH